MMNRIFIIFCAIIFISCSSTDKAPSGVIQPEAMKNVLWDMMRAQFLANQISISDSLTSVVAETKALTQKVFKIHKITSEDFDKSYNWYIKHPEAMRVIFDSLYVQKQRAIHLNLEGKQSDRSLQKKIPINE